MIQNSTRTSLLDSEPYYSLIKACIERGEMNKTIIRLLQEQCDFYTSDDSIRRFRRRHDDAKAPLPETSYTRINGDFAEAQTEPEYRTRSKDDPKPVLDDPDKMLEDRGLDPTQWEITSLTVGDHEGPHKDGSVVTFYRVKFTAKRKQATFMEPVRSDGWKPSRRSYHVNNATHLVVICGDQQTPFHDQHLHSLFCEWLETNRPERGVNLGDLMDYPDVSRHPVDPVNVAKARECQQSGYDVFRAYVEASPETSWQWMPGNHDIRLRDYLVKNAPNAVDALHRVDSPESAGEAVSAINYLLRMDELGVEFIDPRGPYDLAQVQLSSNLAVRHGWIVRQKGGESAIKSLEQCGYSILVGHTHRQAIVQHTAKEIDGKPRQLLAAEVGCMCRVDSEADRDDQGRRFPSYTPMPNWQQGFATAMIYPDGKFKVDLATYVNGILLWGDQRYE
jgi:hypothetical protein